MFYCSNPYGTRPYRQSDKKFQSSKSQGYQSGETWNKILVKGDRKNSFLIYRNRFE